MRSSWVPAWVREHRAPNFDGTDGYSYLWGNTPALDVLVLTDNKGEGYDKDLNMLFAGEYLVRRLPSHTADDKVIESIWRFEKYDYDHCEYPVEV